MVDYDYDDVKKILVFNKKFNKNLLNIPDDVKTITFNRDYSPSKFNKKIQKYILPNSLLRLTLSEKFNQIIEVDVLPQSLKHLTFGDNFNKKIKTNVLPKTLTHLEFGYDFNQIIKINVLPNTLIYLDFGHEFNQIIEKDVLAQSLVYLHLGHNFNQNINDNIIPSSLLYLNISKEFNQEIKINTLPKTLIHLYLYCEAIHESIYERLSELSNLKYLELLGNIDYVNIPLHIQKIGFENLRVKQTNLPINIKKIKLIEHDETYSYEYYLQQIPLGCKIVGVSNIELF